MKRFTAAAVQLRVAEGLATNHARAVELVEEAACGGAELVVLPEIFTCPYSLELMRPNAEAVPDGPTCELLAETARRLSIHLVGGSIPELSEGAVYNTATLWGPDGELLLTHRKVHLFDVDIPGGITFQESATFTAGDRFAVADTELGRIGVAICYDLRFPETFRTMVLAGAELVVLPGAFNTTTGPAHWETLLRARAIESTCYVVACSPARPDDESAYPAWGHSRIVDPYGEVLSGAGREEEVVVAELDGARLAEVRRALPVLRQRRPEAYGV